MEGGHVWWMLMFAVGGAVVGMVLGKGRRADGYQVAKRMDEKLGLKDRLASGYGMLLEARQKEIEQTVFTVLLLKDAEGAAERAGREYRILLEEGGGARSALGGLVCVVVVGVLALVGGGRSGGGREVSKEQREQVQAFNQSIATMAEKIKTIEGLDGQQEKEMLDILKSVQISEDELAKMSRADVLRRLRDADGKIKLPEGVAGGGGAAVKRAIEDKLKAIAEMELVQQQLAQIEAINSRKAVIDLGDGSSAAAMNIKLESSDLQIDRNIALAAAKPGEAEQEYQKRIAEADAKEKMQREAIKKFLAKGGGGAGEVPASEVQKLAAMMASDAEFQGKVMEAIKDPSGKKLEMMREVYRRQLEREFEKENIPRGLRQQLNTYLGPAGS